MTPLTIKRNDTARKIEATLYFNNAALDLTDVTVVLVIRLKNQTTGAVRRDVTMVDASTGKVEYQLVAEDTATSGEYYLEFEVTFLDNTVLSIPNASYYELIVQSDLG